jgi:coenzyme F420-reducing hydrogenase alpha subunit
MTAETQNTAAMEEKIMGAAKDFSQENLENTIHHQMIC